MPSIAPCRKRFRTATTAWDLSKMVWSFTNGLEDALPSHKTGGPGKPVGTTWNSKESSFIWMFPNNSGFSPQIIHFYRDFPYFHHPFWGIPMFGNTQLITVGEMTITGWWFQVSTHLKNMSQMGNIPQVGMKIKNI